ncbi:MAG: hypothetical protein KGL40_04460 [Rhodocyclaceae bacterium]|nr:hypothetical protein [Rhodocyclaceae bacterium]
MKLTTHKLRTILATFGLLLANSAALAAAPTAPLSLANSPLANSSTTVVKPNIMFTIDDSGSMSWDFLPDYVGSASYSTNNSTTNADNDPSRYHNANFNGVTYNPTVTYTPPTYFDTSGALNTTTYPSQTGTSLASGANVLSPLPNWEKVKNDAYNMNNTGTSDLRTMVPAIQSVSWTMPSFKYSLPYYYTFIPGEYCTTPYLTTCTAQTAPSDSYPYAAYVRWCNNSNVNANTTKCQAMFQGSTYYFARWAGMGKWTATIKVTAIAPSQAVSVKINGLSILSSAVTSPATNTATDRTALALAIANSIGTVGSSGSTGCLTSSNSCQFVGVYASANSDTVTITSLSTGLGMNLSLSAAGGGTYTVGNFAISGTQTPGSNVFVPIVNNANYAAYNYPGTSAKASSRTDCAGNSCTYVEEMTNYANWFTYYRSRMQAMKTSVSRAFAPLSQSYRVGFNAISNTSTVNPATTNSKGKYIFMNPDAFQGAQKHAWYDALFNSYPSSSTYLRLAVTKIGRFYANQFGNNQTDPVQYSCQQNFSILSTDGYWNDTTPKQLNGSTSIGNMDGSATNTLLPMREGPVTSGTLADATMYYYVTDLRTAALNNCTGSLGYDVCANNVFLGGGDNNPQQHVTQFTMGLGVPGTLLFQTDYQTATSGDFYLLKKGLTSPVTGNPVVWPDPILNTEEERIDDLWHAAVNGRGTYFSAKDPDSIVQGFTNTLNSIAAKVGAGSAAATSTLNPVAGDNTAYVASYTTMKWQGNLEARSINLTTGAVSETASWCAENVLPSNCISPSTIEADNSNQALSYNCVTPNASSCNGGTMRVDGSCAVPIATTCSGTMTARVSPLSDTRTIYKANAAGTALESFTYSNLSPTQQGYFGEAYLTGKLSQLPDYSPTQKALALGVNFVNYIRGQTGYEDRGSNVTDGRTKLYRFREAVLGDITESQPVYLGKPFFNYADNGYAAFVTAQTNRAKTVFVGANDGMLHAFNGDNGQERWAFVPSAVMPNLWALADRQYPTNHRNYVNGPPTIGDVYDGTNWRTILVGGLNGGGRSYYALDVTNPASPQLLWELSASDLPNLGYSFGQPRIAKQANGTWVVIFTSGYNNINPGNGDGYLFVRNAITGTEVKTMSTAGAGSISVPSGLARISVWADDGDVNNTAKYVYGGDLLGNVWRFDTNSAATNGMQFAILRDPLNNPQPITAAPELGLINNKRIIFVGTGKYLEIADLTDTQKQSIYAMKDDNAATTFVNPRGTLVQQVLTQDQTGAYRFSSNNPVDWFNGRGWYIDLPDSGERVNVNPQLDSGTLFVPTTVPSNTACSPGGYSWLNYLDYKSGTAITGSNGYVSQKTNAPIVGINIFYLPSGKRVVGIVTADGPTPKPPSKEIPPPPGGGEFNSFNVMWREIVQ